MHTREIAFTKRTNSGLTALGIKGGDVLKLVNGEAINLQNARQIISKTVQLKEGDNLTFDIVRDGKAMKIQTKITKVSAEREIFTIEELPASDSKSVLRKAWLKG